MKTLACLLIAAFSALAQTDGITTTASRILTLPPDDAQFAVDVSAPLATTMEQAVRALAGTGIQGSDLVGQTVGNNGISIGGVIGEGAAFPIQGVRTTFSFAFTRPAGELKALVDRLEALRRQPPAGFALQYQAVLAPSANAVEEMRRSVLPQLVAEARRKAQVIATAADLTLGAVASVGDLNSVVPSIIFTGAIRVGSLSSEFRGTFGITVRFAAK